MPTTASVIYPLLKQGPKRIVQLATYAGRQTGKNFENSLADIWELIQEGILDYDSSANVTLVDINRGDTEFTPVPRAHTMYTVRSGGYYCICDKGQDHIESELIFLISDEDDGDDLV